MSLHRTKLIARLKSGDFLDGFSLGFFHLDELGRPIATMAAPIEMKEFSPGEMIDVSNTIALSDDACQRLLEDLWREGFRPKYYQNKGEVVDAKEKHIESNERTLEFLESIITATLPAAIDGGYEDETWRLAEQEQDDS
jgi:hypothetical protein